MSFVTFPTRETVRLTFAFRVTSSLPQRTSMLALPEPTAVTTPALVTVTTLVSVDL